MTGPVYNVPVDARRHHVRSEGAIAGVPATVLALDWVNATNPVAGAVAHVREITSLQSDVHHTFELGILLAGQEERQFEGLVRTVEPGDVWWYAAWQPHGWRTTVPPTDELVIHFVPELLGDAELEGMSWLSFFAAPPEERPVASRPETRRQVLALGHELGEEFAARRWAWRERARCALLSVLVIMGRESGPARENWRWTGSPTGGLARIMPAVELVHVDLSMRLPLRAAANECGLSPSWFRTLFWQTMGMTYSRFERRARLAVAVRLLLGSDRSVEAIGGQTGFADGSHFHRAFFAHYGCTPTEFRTQGRRTDNRGSQTGATAT